MTISLTRREIGLIQEALITAISVNKRISEEIIKDGEFDEFVWQEYRLETLKTILNKIVDNEKDINKQENFFEIIDNIVKK